MTSGVYPRKPLTDEHKRNIGNSQRGSKHWNWQGGITKEAIKTRNSIEYKIWRKDVFERDDYTCQECKKRGVYVEAHHKERFTDNIEKRLSVSNGITLCRECHAKTKGHIRGLTRLTKERIRKNLLGRRLSEKTRIKMSMSKKGSVPWNKGIRKQRPEMICEWCGGLFIPRRNGQIFCSRRCTGRRNGNIKKMINGNLLENNLIPND